MTEAKLPLAPAPAEPSSVPGGAAAPAPAMADTAVDTAVAPSMRTASSTVSPVQPASGGWFATTMLMVALLALVLSGLLWQRLDRIQQELAKRSADVAEVTEKSRDSADQALELVQELQARVSVAEVKLSEVSLQRTQLEELMLSVSRSRDDTLVLDIESGVRLAMQQAELTGSAQPLLSALQAADRRIAKAAQPRLNPVQRAMARDMDRIKASPVADLPLLASRLDELARAVDEWPLLNAEPKKRVVTSAVKNNKDAALVAQGAKSTAMTVPAVEGAATKAESGTSTPTAAAPVTDGVPTDHKGAPEPQATSGSEVAQAATEPKPATPPRVAHKKSLTEKTQKPVQATSVAPEEAEGNLWRTAQLTWMRWWERLTENVSVATRDLVRVSRIDEPDAVLLSPEQAVFLRENLKLRLLNARLSLLSRQVPASRADMQAVKLAMAKYFDPQSPVNKQAQQALGDVLHASRSLELPRPDETLAALAKAAGGR